MARQRAKVQPEVEEIPVPEGDVELAEDTPVEDMPEGWQLAYKRAIMKKCSPKAARLYADAHGDSFEKNPARSVDSIDAEIERLQGERDSLAS